MNNSNNATKKVEERDEVSLFKFIQTLNKKNDNNKVHTQWKIHFNVTSKCAYRSLNKQCRARYCNSVCELSKYACRKQATHLSFINR